MWTSPRLLTEPRGRFCGTCGSPSSKSSSASGLTRNRRPRNPARKLTAPCTSSSTMSRWSTSGDRSRAVTSASGKSVRARERRLKPSTNWSITFACTRARSRSRAPFPVVAKYSRAQKISRFTRGRTQVSEKLTNSLKTTLVVFIGVAYRTCLRYLADNRIFFLCSVGNKVTFCPPTSCRNIPLRTQPRG